MSQLPVHTLKTNAKALDLGSSSVYHLPNWHTLTHDKRLKVIRQIAMARGRDPRIAQLSTKILKNSGARPRQYVKQAESLLRWVQNPKNIYYVNEPGERLQDPIYTIKAGFGDCDDMVIMLTSLFESVGLPWKLVLSGRGPSGKLRYIEDGVLPTDVKWSHIYCMVGDRPFTPQKWYFCEPTVEGVPLGWDVISGDHRYLPEMSASKGGPAVIAESPKANSRYRPPPLPPVHRRSPAYAEAYSGPGVEVTTSAEEVVLGQLDDALGAASTGSAVGGAIAEAVTESAWRWDKIGVAIVTGITVSVGTSMLLDYLKGEGTWKGQGSFLDRWAKHGSKLAPQTFLTPPGV